MGIFHFNSYNIVKSAWFQMTQVARHLDCQNLLIGYCTDWHLACRYDLHGRVTVIMATYMYVFPEKNLIFKSLLRNKIYWKKYYNNNNNIFILYSAKSIYSSKRFTIKMYKIATVKLIRNVKFIINIQVKNYATCS